ncbi:MAG: HipA family kinase, partial [Terriglobia bacterium]
LALSAVEGSRSDMRRAVEHIRKMRGGAQAHLLRCDDAAYYVVKFQNNPQHLRILANEMLGYYLATALGLPVARAEVVKVEAELIALTPELVILQRGRPEKCSPGFHFGSRFPGEPGRVAVHDFLPDDRLAAVANLADFAGMLLFDQWTCNTNGRQGIFVAEPFRPTGYRVLMIDQGFCFNAGEWNFPDSPLRGLYPHTRVYERITGWASWEPYLTRLQELSPRVLDEAAAAVPPDWYAGASDALDRLLTQLDRRRHRLRELITATRHCSRQPFPNWRD